MSGPHSPRPAVMARPALDGLATGLGWFSIGLGLVELLAPKQLCETIGLEGHETLVRAFGARELATGIAILASHDPTPWVAGRVLGDVADLAVLATAGGPDTEQQAAMRRFAIGAVAGVAALDVLCATGLNAAKQLSAPGDYDYGDRAGFPRPARAMRGAASDFEAPRDFQTPPLLRPWTPADRG
jgi:hypothetical protein